MPPAPPLRILSIVGTRPEAIKLAPVALAAAGRPSIDHRILLTGQHETLAPAALDDFGLRADFRLTTPPVRGVDALEAMLELALYRHLEADPPDLVLVQGDTASAVAGARAAAALGIPLGHVEAGLRSFDLARPFPEERNRIAIDRLADLLFAPAAEAAANLDREADVAGRVLVTGNTGIDALLWMTRRVAPAPRSGRPLILATCHRRESFGSGIAEICEALARLAARGDVDVILPVHPNAAVRDPIRARLAGLGGVTLCEPLPYPTMVAAMCAARLILTDSGGIQEEAATLGIPTLVLRDVTERQEGVASGNLMLVGTGAVGIVSAAGRLLDDEAAHAAMTTPTRRFGDGHAADAILDACQSFAVNRMVQLRA